MVKDIDENDKLEDFIGTTCTYFEVLEKNKNIVIYLSPINMKSTMRG
jgi:hypothetical protein